MNTVKGLRLWLADKPEDMPVEGTLRVGLSTVTMRDAPDLPAQDDRVDLTPYLTAAAILVASGGKATADNDYQGRIVAWVARALLAAAQEKP